MRTGFVLLAVCALSITACGDDPSGPGTNAARQQSAKALWQATRPARYSFVASRSCECLPDDAGPVRIEVNEDNVVSVHRVDTDASVSISRWFDIDDLFNLIDTELTTRPSRLETEYNTQYGFPTYVAYGEREIDSGAVIEVSAFTAIKGPTGGLRRLELPR
jgi:hypothetical protein